MLGELNLIAIYVPDLEEIARIIWIAAVKRTQRGGYI